MSITSSTPSRQTVARSSTMPFRRALTISALDKPLASIRASSTKGLRRLSTLRIPKASDSCSTSTLRPSPSMESVVVFTTPDYKQPAVSCPPPTPAIAPLTLLRPPFERAMTLPAARPCVNSPAFKQVVCDSAPHKASVASIESVSSASTSRRRRSSSVSTVESFSSNECHLTLSLRLRALPSTILGLLASITAVICISILPAMAADTPKRVPAPRPCEREITLTAEQELNPPKLPKSSAASRLSRRVSKTYARTVLRVARARRTSNPPDALAALFTPTPKRVRAPTPAHVDPKTLVSEVPLWVDPSPVALPPAKGPAATVRPARKVRRLSTLLTVKEEPLDRAVLCAGW